MPIPQKCLAVYKTLIRSHIDYFAPLVHFNKTQQNKLQVLQNTERFLCIGAMNFTPINILQAEALEPTFAIIQECISNKCYFKVR